MDTEDVIDVNDVTEQIQQEQERDFKRAECDLDDLIKRVKSGRTTRDDCDKLIGTLKLLGVNIK